LTAAGVPAEESAPAYRIPDRPSIVGSLRSAASDFFFNSWRLVPANAIWGVLLIALFLATALYPPLVLLAPVLAIPVAGIYSLAAQIARGEPVDFADALRGMRRYAGTALAIGVVATVALFVFSVNIFIGLQTGDIAGGVFAMLAGYADLGIVMYLVALWPIVVDPIRERSRVRDRLRLALLVVAARPGRILILTVVIAVIYVVSTALFAVLLTATVAYVALVATRYVLPAADRLEGRATVPLPAQ
jgi:hypothetical protein